MRKEGTESPPVKQFFTLEEDQIDLALKRAEVDAKQQELEENRRRQEMREEILKTLTWIFAGSIAFTLAVLIAQGFHIWGFDLDLSILRFLGFATIGEVAGLIGIVIKAIFERPAKS